MTNFRTNGKMTLGYEDIMMKMLKILNLWQNQRLPAWNIKCSKVEWLFGFSFILLSAKLLQECRRRWVWVGGWECDSIRIIWTKRRGHNLRYQLLFHWTMQRTSARFVHHMGFVLLKKFVFLERERSLENYNGCLYAFEIQFGCAGRTFEGWLVIACGICRN